MNEVNKNPEDFIQILNNWYDDTSLPFSWWLKYVYHYSDIHNIISILKCGKLYSRSLANQHGLMYNDNANREVIDKTSSFVQGCVRLYFRPLTPTQYLCEGYKCTQQRSKNANVPIPVFLTFKSYDILALPNSKFSDIGLYHGNILYSTAEDLSKFDYRKIYSIGPMKNLDLKDYRHAEIVIPDELSLDYLENIWCRTPAEYNTMMYLLKQNHLYDKYSKIVGLKGTSDLFYKNGSFVDEVVIRKNEFTVTIHTADERLGHTKFIIKVNLIINDDVLSRSFQIEGHGGSVEQYTFQISSETAHRIQSASHCELEITFDDCIMYKSDFNVQYDYPF